MAVTVDGVVFFEYGQVLSWDGNDSVPGATATITDQTGGALVVRSPTAPYPLLTPVANSRGIWPPVLVSAGISFWDSGSGFKQIRASTDFMLAGNQAAAAQAAAEAAQAAAEATPGVPGPPGAPYTVLTFTAAGGWPARTGATGAVWWALEPGITTWPGNPPGLLVGDYAFVDGAIVPA